MFQPKTYWKSRQVAQKREQNIQDVPIAITTFTEDQLTALGIEKSIDITMLPGVPVAGIWQAGTQFGIEGVTQNDFGDIIEAPNAVYLDEGYVAIAQAQTFTVFDIDRVEVLKGPQGILFRTKRNRRMIQFISSTTFDGIEGYVDVGVWRIRQRRECNRTVLQATIDDPLSGVRTREQPSGTASTMVLRKNLYTSQDQLPFSVILDLVLGADLGDDDTKSRGGCARFRPSDSLRIDLSFNYASSEVATGPYQKRIYDGHCARP